MWVILAWYLINLPFPRECCFRIWFVNRYKNVSKGIINQTKTVAKEAIQIIGASLFGNHFRHILEKWESSGQWKDVAWTCAVHVQKEVMWEPGPLLQSLYPLSHCCSPNSWGFPCFPDLADSRHGEVSLLGGHLIGLRALDCRRNNLCPRKTLWCACGHVQVTPRQMAAASVGECEELDSYKFGKPCAFSSGWW